MRCSGECNINFNGLMQEGLISITNALELHPSCTNPSNCGWQQVTILNVITMFIVANNLYSRFDNGWVIKNMICVIHLLCYMCFIEILAMTSVVILVHSLRKMIFSHTKSWFEIYILCIKFPNVLREPRHNVGLATSSGQNVLHP